MTFTTVITITNTTRQLLKKVQQDQAKQQQKIVRNKDDGIFCDDAAPQCQIHNC